jgi:hypothetical protein
MQNNTPPRALHQFPSSSPHARALNANPNQPGDHARKHSTPVDNSKNAKRPHSDDSNENKRPVSQPENSAIFAHPSLPANQLALTEEVVAHHVNSKNPHVPVVPLMIQTAPVDTFSSSSVFFGGLESPEPMATSPDASSPSFSHMEMSPTQNPAPDPILPPPHSPATPRVEGLKQKMLLKQTELAQKLKILDTQFTGLNSDVQNLSARTESNMASISTVLTTQLSTTTPKLLPPSLSFRLQVGPKIPALSLNAAKTIIREETREGAKELNYQEEARLISQRIVTGDRSVCNFADE